MSQISVVVGEHKNEMAVAVIEYQSGNTSFILSPCL